MNNDEVVKEIEKLGYKVVSSKKMRVRHIMDGALTMCLKPIEDEDGKLDKPVCSFCLKRARALLPVTFPGVEPLYDGQKLIGFYAKGKWTEDWMVKGIRDYIWPDFDFTGQTTFNVGTYRFVPAPFIDNASITLEKSRPGRGAFTATVVWL